MRKFWVCLCLLVSLAIPSACSAGLSDYPTVAVIPFVNQVTTRNLSEGDLESVRSIVDTGLVQSGYFSMVERARVDALLGEIEFGMSGLVDPGTAAKFGKMLGAQYVVIGSITGFGADPKHRGNHMVKVSARMVEVETARIALAGRGTGSAKAVSDALEAAADDVVEGKKGMLMMLRGGRGK